MYAIYLCELSFDGLVLHQHPQQVTLSTVILNQIVKFIFFLLFFKLTIINFVDFSSHS